MSEDATQPPQEVPDEILEQWSDEFLALETTLTIYQLTLLLKIRAGLEPMGVFEPVWIYCTKGNGGGKLYQAPLLEEHVLMECAQARALERLGFVQLERDPQEGPCWKLTSKGAEAVQWWGEDLRGMLPNQAESSS